MPTIIDTKEAKQLVKALAKIAYPDYSGRKFKVVVQSTYHMSNYWDGGSRNYCVAVNLPTSEIKPPHPETTTPWNQSASSSFEIPPGVGILERCVFCGKELGIRPYVSPESLAALQQSNSRKEIACVQS